MASTLIFVVQPLIYDHLRHLDTNYAGTEGQDVGIVVSAGHSRAVRLAAGADQNAFYLACCQTDTDTGSADCDAVIRLTGCYRASNLLAVYRVIAAFAGVGSEVDDLVTLLLYLCLDGFLHFHCGVIISHCDLFHNIINLTKKLI